MSATGIMTQRELREAVVEELDSHRTWMQSASVSPSRTAWSRSPARAAATTSSSAAHRGAVGRDRGSGPGVTVVLPGGVATNITTIYGVAMPSMVSSFKAPRTASGADAARQIIQGMQRGAYRVRIGSDARLMDRLSRLSPRRATELIANQMKQLLAPVAVRQDA
jgi:hypothetical protein